MMNLRYNKVIQAIANLVSTWWYIDQVRLSPREGLLLRLQPPCSLLIGSQRADIVNRHAIADHPHPGVVYDCITDKGQGTLTVKLLDQAGNLHILWASSQQIQTLHPADLDLYG